MWANQTDSDAMSGTPETYVVRCLSRLSGRDPLPW